MIINNEMQLSYPEGFHVMDEEERRNLNFYSSGPVECIADPDRHIIISVGWQPLSIVFRLTLKTREVAGKMEERIAKSMVPYHYRNEGSLERELGGESASGFRYSYQAEELGMTGESFAVKHKSTLYNIHYYSRTALAEENQVVWTAILDSIRWS